METVLKIKNLNLFFGEYQALYDVCLDIHSGEMHALVGESGCGKTMTAMSILRLIPKQASIKSGEIYYGGENILNLKEREMRNLRGNKIVLIPESEIFSASLGSEARSISP